MTIISKSLLTVPWIGVLLVFNGIISGSEAKSTNGTDDSKRVNSSAINPNPILISNGQILSRALLLDLSILLPAKQAFQNNNTGNDLTLAKLNRSIAFPG